MSTHEIVDTVKSTRESVLKEREDCALTCERLAQSVGAVGDSAMARAAKECARAIRHNIFKIQDTKWG